MNPRLLALPLALSLACTEGPAATETTAQTETSGADTEDTSETDTDTGETGSQPTCDGSGLEPGDHVVEMTHDGRLRVFTAHVPPGYDGTELTPVVLDFHGLGSNSTQQQFFSYMDPLADAEGFIVVYPDGTQNADGDRAWDAGICCTDEPVDDVGFVRAMLDELDARLCVDPDRRFATGMSNGGLFSYRLGCEAADVIAAVAPVAGALGIDPFTNCQPVRPMPLWQIHGTVDGRVPFDGARLSAEYWAELNGCGGETSVTYQNGVVTCEAWDCPAGSEVEFCTAEGVDHCWPGQPFCIDPPSTEDIDSTATIWEFFMAHPMPR